MSALVRTLHWLPEFDPDGDLCGLLIDRAPDGILIVDDAGRIVICNQSLVDMFGYLGPDLLGKTVEVLVPDDLARDHVMLREGYADDPVVRPMNGHRRLEGRCADGSTLCIEISLSPVVHEGRHLVVAIVRDVSERIATEELAASTAQALELLGERERIARDLHDTIIQELFATGMSLQATARHIDDPSLADRVLSSVDALDESIRHIRTVIFGLTLRSDSDHGLRAEVLKIAHDEGRALGFAPKVTFSGALDELPPQLAEHVVAVVREALSNVARHARATRVEVDLRTGSDEVHVEVRDNGAGLPGEVVAGRGMRNLRGRAESVGGTFSVSARNDGGTVAQLRLPL